MFLFYNKISVFLLFHFADIPEFSPVRFLSEPSDVIAVVGRAVTLNCSVDLSVVPVIRWTQGSSPVRDDDPTRTIMPNGALHIASASPLDEGSYRCVVDLGAEEGEFFSKVGTLSIASKYENNF